ncbi:MAG: hypothetical protein Phog2KO_07880 [Phototrophicaceae bacterium]
MNNDFKITVITEDSDFLTAVQNATKGNVVQEHSHEKSKLRDYRQKIVIIDYDSVPLTQEKLKEWSDNTQFLILVLEQAHDDIIQGFQDYISDVWYKPLNSIILEKRLSMLGTFHGEALDISEYIGFISSEFRTPLVSISGYSDILLSGQISTSLTEEQHEFVSIIKNNSSTINVLLDDVRTYFQIKYNSFTCNFETLNIYTILGKISGKKLYQYPNSTEPLYNFELHQEDSLPEIYADKYRLSQIIEMLLSVTQSLNSEQTKLSISQEDIFIKFSISSEKMFIIRHENGFHFNYIPFGETIIPHIIEAHKGTIQIETSHETGSTFSFTIPIADNQDE